LESAVLIRFNNLMRMSRDLVDRSRDVRGRTVATSE